MPKRTNEYQKLILSINKHLSHTDAVVTESRMLWDCEFETDREVDICIEQVVAGTPVIVGIECTDLSRPLGPQKVEALHAKHKNLGIHKTIIVSKSGFTRTVEAFAKKRGVELLSFGKAMKRSWPTYMDKLKEMKIVHYEARMEFISIGFNPEDGQAEFYPGIRNEVKFDDGWINIVDYSYALFRSGSNGSLLNMPKGQRLKAKSGCYEDAWEFNPELKIRDDKGCLARCSRLSVKYRVQLHESPVKMKYDQYLSNDVAYGETGPLGPFKNAELIVSADCDFETQGDHKFKVTIDLDTGDAAFI